MKHFCVGLVLLVFLGLHLDTSKADEVQYDVRIRERGIRFSEKIRISEKENTVTFEVPKHNEANRSDVLNDFNLKLTITRLPDAGICTIKPLEKGLPNPRKMKSDMVYIKNANVRMPSKNTLMVSSSKWTIDKRVREKDLHPSVSKFCAGLPVYRLSEIAEDAWQMVKGNDTASTRKRTFKYLAWKLCPKSYESKNCNPNKWIINCQFRRYGTCVYWMKCKVPIKDVTNLLKDCKFYHNWNSVVCCVPDC